MSSHAEGAGDLGLAASPGSGLEISTISKRYGSVQAVNGLSLSVPRGALIGFLGPNGAGKTTTMRAILGMVRLDGGQITWDGTPVNDELRSRIGYMPQERGLYARMKVREQVIYFGRLAGMSKTAAADRADFWIDRVGVADRADSLVQELSGGNQQRVQLAVALVHDPELLVLDEPFAGLDPVAAENMRVIISERAAAGASVLFSSHQLDLVEDLCEQVAIVAAGSMVATGAITDIRSAAPVRVLRVRWSAPVAEWQPVAGELVRFDGLTAEVTLPADADVDRSIQDVVSAGPVAELGFEPPGLADLFADLVSGDPAERDRADAGMGAAS